MNNVIRSWARFVSGTLLPRVAYPVVRGPLKGARFVLGTVAGDGGGATVYVNMSEPEQTAAFVASVRQGQVLFDIGANVGYYTILGARLVGQRGKVFAFEPAIQNLTHLYRHVQLNSATNVTIVSAACSDRIALAVFAPGENSATGHLADRVGPDAESPGMIVPVPTVTVDAVVQETGVVPDVMKIDVEGAELSVLRGAQATLRSSRPSIFLSTHSGELRSRCLQFLGELGYTWDALGAEEPQASEFLARHPER